MIYWAPLLHFYQPPTQIHWVLKKVCTESYRPLVGLFHGMPHAKVTVNINGVLTEMLDEHEMSDVIDGLKELAERGQLEFTGSGKYHPILPLIPHDEMLRQIVQNYQVNKHFFGKSYAPNGFFPPEMCYSKDIVKPVLDSGHSWIILSGIACPSAWPTDTIYQIGADWQKLSVVFRDDILSNKISFKNIDARGFVAHLKSMKSKTGDTYVVTAMDAETFGHHIQQWERVFLGQVYETLRPGQPRTKDPPAKINPKTTRDSETKASPASGPATKGDVLAKKHEELLGAAEIAETGEIKVVTISELVELFSGGKPIEPRPSSWSTTIDDFHAGNYYPLWKSPDNQIHQLLWQHLKIAIDLTRKALELATTELSRNHADIARSLLDKALHSDQFWWASQRPMWDVNLIHRGLLEQFEVILNAYKAIKISNASEDEKAEYYYRFLASRDLSGKILELLLAR